MSHLDAYLGTGGGEHAQREAATAYLLSALRRNPPGYPTDNRAEQSRHYTGAVYLFTQVYMDMMGQATPTVVHRRRKKSGAVVRKALPTPGQQSQDQEWVPARPDHPLARLLESPFRRTSFGDVARQMMLQYWLTGTAHVWANPNRAGVPVELVVLPTALLWPQPMDWEEYPEGAYRLNWYRAGSSAMPGSLSGSGAVIDARHVMRLRNEHPLWVWDATSPLTAAARQMDILEAIDDSAVAMFRHGINPGLLFMLPGMTGDQLVALATELQKTHGGAHNYGKPLAIGGGQTGAEKFDVRQLTPDVGKLAYAESREQAMEFAGALFGVPKGVAGFTSAGSYSEFFAELKQFSVNKLRGLAKRVGDLFTSHLAAHWGPDYRVQLDLPTMDDPDLLERRLSTDGQNGTLMMNEYRALRGMPPLKGGDVPVPVYLELAQQKAQPQPDPAQAAPGGPPGGVSMGQDAPQADTPPPDDAREDESGGVMDMVMAALGVGGDSPGMVRKAKGDYAKTPLEKKSGVFRDKNGRRYRVEGGRRVPVEAPKSTPEQRQAWKGREAAARDGLRAERSGAPAPAGKPAGGDLHAQILAFPGAKAWGFTPDILAKMGPDGVADIAKGLGIPVPQSAPASATPDPGKADTVDHTPAPGLSVPDHIPLAPADKPKVRQALRRAKPKLRELVKTLQKRVAELEAKAGKGGDAPAALPQPLWVPRSGGKPAPGRTTDSQVFGARSFARPSKPPHWLGRAAVKNAPAVAAKLGISAAAAAHALWHAAEWVARQVPNLAMLPGTAGAKVWGAIDRADEWATDKLHSGVNAAVGNRAKQALIGPNAESTRTAGGAPGAPKRPKNPGGKGSLPPRQKAFDADEKRDDSGRWAAGNAVNAAARGRFGKDASRLKEAEHDELRGHLGHSEDEYYDALDAAWDIENGDLTDPGGGAADDHDDPPGRPNEDLPDEARPKLTRGEADAVREYIAEDSSYDAMNSALRSGRASPDDYALQDAILRAGELPEPVAVRRGLDFGDDDALRDFADRILAAHESGDTWEEKGFVSASTAGGFSGNVQLTIHARHGLDASYYGHNQGEFLMPAGSEFRVLAAKLERGKLTATLEQLTAPRQKALGANTLSGSAGGFLVPGAARKRRRRKRLAVFVKAELAALSGGV